MQDDVRQLLRADAEGLYSYSMCLTVYTRLSLLLPADVKRLMSVFVLMNVVNKVELLLESPEVSKGRSTQQAPARELEQALDTIGLTSFFTHDLQPRGGENQRPHLTQKSRIAC